MLTPSMGFWVDSVDEVWLRQTGRFEDGGHDVDDVVPLVADLAAGLDALGPADRDRVAGAAVVRSHLLGVLEGRVHGVRPAHRIVVERLGAADQVELGQHVLEGLRDAVEGHQLVEGAVKAALGAGAVVTGDVDEEGVLVLAQVLEGIDQPSDLLVGVLGEAGVGLHEAA